MSFLKESMKAGPSKDSLEPQTRQATARSEDLTETSSIAQSPPRKRKSGPSVSARQTIMEEELRVLTTPDPKPADGEEYFAQPIAASLRKPSPIAREHAKCGIQQVLLKYCAKED
ncbi:uncharacterized protein LOC119733792 [Patiria miniata]|uniref:Uncharacterized protein n=1 Tax=Patiria miniata TaxID=46514 RepID=A0A914AH94_PATMI|nr:uncharacterized protein LOC119733792 [Patiria miniata]